MSTISRSINILVADDQETHSFYLESSFAQSKLDVRVHVVSDGQSVIDFLKNEGEYQDAPRPNLIMLDLKMPVKSGYEVLEEVKGDDAFRQIPIIVMSSSTNQSDIDAVYSLHANAFVSKVNAMNDMRSFINSIEQFWFMQALLPYAEANDDAA